MGDRANVAIQSNGSRVYLYTHWRGSELPELVRKALARKQRWDDPAYLARIIFDTLSEGSQGNETGFGISAEPLDNSYPFLVVCPDSQMVALESDEREGFGYIAPATARPIPFDKYVRRSKLTWEALRK